MNQISGYLELNGTISKVTSCEDIKEFLHQLDQTTCMLTEKDLDEMCSRRHDKSETFTDDCDAVYSCHPQMLVGVSFLEPTTSYRVLDGTIAIQDSAFYTHARYDGNNYCKISSIYMTDSVKAIGEQACYGLSTLKSIRFSEVLIKIGNQAFWACKLLSDICLPDSLKIIGHHSFQATGIKSLRISESVMNIGSGAFAYCGNLTTVKFCGIPQHLGSGIFDQCKNLQTIYVPIGSVDYFVDKLYPIDNVKFVEQE